MAAKKKPAPKRGASRYQAPPRKPVPGWVWLTCGLLIGAFVVFLLQLEPGRDEIKRIKDEKPPPAALTPEQLAKADAARAEAALNGQVPPALPSAGSTPPTGTPTPPPSVAKAPLTTQFFLQAGSFRKQADADKVRAQIILLGQNVQVESGTVREEIWYRVLVGPFASREQLGAAQKQLAASGFGNLLLQQRQSR